MKFNDDWALALTNSYPTDPLVALKIYEYNPCLNIGDTSQVKGSYYHNQMRPSYILEKMDFVERCDQRDLRFKHIHGPTITE